MTVRDATGVIRANAWGREAAIGDTRFKPGTTEWDLFHCRFQTKASYGAELLITATTTVIPVDDSSLETDNTPVHLFLGSILPHAILIIVDAIPKKNSYGASGFLNYRLEGPSARNNR